MSNIDYVSEAKEIISKYCNVKETDDLQSAKLQRTGIFDSFYSEFIICFEIKVHELFLELMKQEFIVNINEVVQECLYSFRSDLIDICKKILISEIFKMRENGLLKGETKFDRYEYFDRLLTGKKKLQIIEENPVMAYLIVNKINTKINHIGECLERLAYDFDVIKKEININNKVLKNIKLDEGDTHNNGKSVIILEFNDGYKIVYKPHPMSSDESFGRLVEYINNSNYLKYSLKVAKSINKGPYGWQEFITYKECDSVEQVKAHFYRFGALTAIFNMIRSKDFHYENLIAHGEFPIPIDLETILSNRKFYINNNDSYTLADAFAIEIDNSIFGTLMIPQNLEMLKFQVDMSGLNGGISSTEDNLEFIRILNTGTDEIGYEKVIGHIDAKQNRVMMNGEIIELYDYIPDIILGFDECYEFFIHNKKELTDRIKNNEIFKGEYRQVLRATVKYIKFIDAAIHPVYTKSFNDRLKVFSILYGKGELNEETKNRITAEINQLCNNDVPYFWLDFNSRNLYCAEGTCLVNYFEKTMCELILNRINLANRMDKEKQILYLKGSIASIINIKDSSKYKYSYSCNALGNISIDDNDSCYLNMARKMAEYIENRCIYNSSEGKCSFMALNVQNDGTIKYGPLNRNLYEGAGVILFLAHLAKIDGNDKYKRMIDGILFGYDELYNKPEFRITSHSVFTGMGSLLYIYYNLWSVFKERDYYVKYLECISSILEMNFSGIDIINGSAGLSLVLANIYDKEKSNLLLELMQKCGESLYLEVSDILKSHLTGFSHGYAGFSSALFALGHHLNKEEYYVLAKELIQKENQYIDYEKGNWMDLRDNKEADPVYWCHGASGISLSRIISREFLKDCDKTILDKDIEMGVKKILKDGFTANLSQCLCHGSFGNIDCLLFIAKKTGDVTLSELVNNLAKTECKKILDKGIECANPIKVETINFMLGLSGIGYELLRLHDNSIPSVLALEVL